MFEAASPHQQPVEQFIFYKSEMPRERFSYSSPGVMHPVRMFTGGSWKKQ